jgi:hypothetical protein
VVGAREEAGAPVSEIDDAAVLALARSTVEKAAPEEIVIFPAARDAYLAGGGGEGEGGTRMLGFGLEAAAALLAPIAIEVAKDVLGYLKEQVTELASKKGKEGVDAVISRLGSEEGEAAAGGEADPAAPRLSEEQLEQVRARAIEKAKQLKLDDDRAALLADSLVGSLATA